LTKEEREGRQTTDNTLDKRRERRKTDNRQYHWQRKRKKKYKQQTIPLTKEEKEER
jgi:hypothetical protein